MVSFVFEFFLIFSFFQIFVGLFFLKKIFIDFVYILFILFILGKQILTVSANIPITRTTLTFEESSLRTVRGGTVSRTDACDASECRRRWIEMCYPYVAPSLTNDHWIRIRRARRFIIGENKRGKIHIK